MERSSRTDMWYKNNKYGNKKVNVGGETFDSRLEARRFQILRLLERAGEIRDLRRQVPFELIPAYTKGRRKVRPAVYVADFVYTDKHGRTHVEDTKGYKTAEYKLKKKIFEWRYEYTLDEITKEDE